MDSALGFGGRHALDAVNTGFVFEKTKHLAAGDFKDHLLEAADFGRAALQVLALPSAQIGVALIGTHQLCGEERGLVATGTGADFNQRVAVFVRVGGQQRVLQVF